MFRGLGIFFVALLRPKSASRSTVSRCTSTPARSKKTAGSTSRCAASSNTSAQASSTTAARSMLPRAARRSRCGSARPRRRSTARPSISTPRRLSSARRPTCRCASSRSRSARTSATTARIERSRSTCRNRRNRSGRSCRCSRSFRSPPRVSVVHLRAQQPQSGCGNRESSAAISAEFTHRVNAGSVNVTLDDSNVTGWTQRDDYRFSLTPRRPLWVGSHTVRVTGRDASGVVFDRAWEFTRDRPTAGAERFQLRNQHRCPTHTRNPRTGAATHRGRRSPRNVDPDRPWYPARRQPIVTGRAERNLPALRRASARRWTCSQHTVRVTDLPAGRPRSIAHGRSR